MAEDALRIRALEREPGEELRCHAPAPARGVGTAGVAGSARRGSPQTGEQVALAPHGAKASWQPHVARLEVRVHDEGAGVDVSDRVDQADDPPGPAQVQAGERLAAERAEVEERVPGENFGVVREEAVHVPELGSRRPELVPHPHPPARRPKAGHAQLGAEKARQGQHGLKLAGVVAGDDHAQLERPEAGIGEAFHRPHGGGEAPRPPDRIVRGSRGAVEADLDVEVVHGGQPAGAGGRHRRAVRRELDPDPAPQGVRDDLLEVGPDRGLAAADVDVEDLHRGQLVDDAERLCRGQLVRVAQAGARQAVDT